MKEAIITCHMKDGSILHTPEEVAEYSRNLPDWPEDVKNAVRAIMTDKEDYSGKMSG